MFTFACYLHLSHFQGYLRQGSDKEVGSKGGCGKEAEHLVREAQFQAGINVNGKICFLGLKYFPEVHNMFVHDCQKKKYLTLVLEEGQGRRKPIREK